ncbi:MAG: RagB/SusD family nutrient uptake outer membrane protein [Spirosomaceae bacterium]|nr:RagB/SusD family nutrient uptake outer membrane protein [Spirosomataceae bacterium]
MKNIVKFILFGLLTVGSISCKDFLEPEIRSEVLLENFGSTPSEADFLLTQAYVNMRDDNFMGSVYWSLFPTDYSVPPAGTVLARSFISRMQNDPSDGEAFGMWTAQYRVIASANLVIGKAAVGMALADAPASDINNWKRIDGEARFIRGLAYFNLVRLFRNVPVIENYFKNFDDIDNVSNADTDKMAEQEKLVYSFIIKDLTAAADQLAANSGRGRAGKYAAHAVLGKVYLNMASIEKFRDKTSDGSANYTLALTNLNAVINSNSYGLKTYFPDNFIRTKQYTGANEFLFTLEYNELDKSGGSIFGSTSGFVNNAGTGSGVNVGTLNNANGGSLATDFGWSVFDLESPGDLVRRFWTFEDGEFRTFDANGNKVLQRSVDDCPNGGGPNCEVFLRSSEPYPWNRPYWFETIDDANSFRSNPSNADVVTLPNGKTNFTTIWGGGNVGNNPGVKLVKYRRNPISQATYTDATFDADMPIMRYSEVLLMYAEAANELNGANTKPANGKYTSTEAVNLIRNRARNFVYYNDLTINKRIIDNSPYTATYGDVFSRQPKVGKNPLKTANAADTLSKYYFEISVVKGIREVPSAPVIRNFKDFPETKNFVPDFPTTLSQDDFRERLLNERWRELAGEHNNRWYDLVRYGRLITSVQETQVKLNPLTNRTLQATPYGQDVLREPNDKYAYLAIPQSEISRNPNLKQNPGY